MNLGKNHESWPEIVWVEDHSPCSSFQWGRWSRSSIYPHLHLYIDVYIYIYRYYIYIDIIYIYILYILYIIYILYIYRYRMISQIPNIFDHLCYMLHGMGSPNIFQPSFRAHRVRWAICRSPQRGCETQRHRPHWDAPSTSRRPGDRRRCTGHPHRSCTRWTWEDR